MIFSTTQMKIFCVEAGLESTWNVEHEPLSCLFVSLLSHLMHFLTSYFCVNSITCVISTLQTPKSHHLTLASCVCALDANTPCATTYHYVLFFPSFPIYSLRLPFWYLRFRYYQYYLSLAVRLYYHSHLTCS